MNRKIKIKIFGMTCDDCVIKIKNSLKMDPGVLDVNISLENAMGEVTIDDTKTDEKNILNNVIFRSGHYRAKILKE